MTLRKKILLGYGIALVLTVVVLAWAVVNLFRLGKASKAILRENYNSIIAAEHMIDAIERQDSGALILLLGFEEGSQQFRENEVKFLEWFSRAKDNITIEGEAEIISRINEGYQRFLIDYSSLEGLKGRQGEEANNFYHSTLLLSFLSVRDACAELRLINEATMVKASNNARAVAQRAIWSMLAVGLTAVSLGLAFSLMLAGFLTRPLGHVMSAVQSIASGDYDVTVPDRSSDELGLLAGEFNEMTAKLRRYRDMNVESLLAEKTKSEAIIGSIEDGILLIDEEFDIAGINPAAAKALGTTVEQARGRHFLELLKDERLFAKVKASVESERPPKVEEGEDVITLRQEGEPSFHQFAITPIHAKSGQFLGVVLLLRNITRLKELDRLKNEFVMMASHELRTPLTGIGMSIDLLLERTGDKIPPDDRELLTAAQEETRRLKALVNDLLTLSKIESGRIEMDFEATDLQSLFNKVVDNMRAQAEDKHIDLVVDFPPDLPGVRVDPNKIAWVLTNLVANAIQSIKEGGSVRISGRRILPRVYVSVADTGAGIPFELQSRVFDKFVQVGDGEGHGTGLGLAICKEIVHAHGGTIWVDSTPGEGSTFTFAVPEAA
ncbi:MAG TPA: HAMP domain-containing protein [Candidatus Aminicenantes bacterium]|nr:HAMP domain-containing protein [Candidatus Aminicenantes bacterium]